MRLLSLMLTLGCTPIGVEPVPSDLVITEILVGSYVEIKNTSTQVLDLSETVLSNTESQTYLQGSLHPGDYLVIGVQSWDFVKIVDTLTPLDKDQLYLSQVVRVDTADTATITALYQLDAVRWDSSWPWSNNASMSLLIETIDANDYPLNWCTSQTQINELESGNPGFKSDC